MLDAEREQLLNEVPVRIEQTTIGASMGARRGVSLAITALSTAMGLAVLAPARAEAQQKPNIIVIMGDDIGWFNIGAYNQGIMAGSTPNLDKLAVRGNALHRLLRRGELHGRSSKLHHR